MFKPFNDPGDAHHHQKKVDTIGIHIAYMGTHIEKCPADSHKSTQQPQYRLFDRCTDHYHRDGYKRCYENGQQYHCPVQRQMEEPRYKSDQVAQQIVISKG